MDLHKMKSLIWLTAILVTATAFSQSADPIIGTWELNVAKSKYGAEPIPKSHVRTYVLAGDEIKATSRTVDATGKVTNGAWSFSARYDGKDRAMNGFDEGDSLSIKRVDDHTFAVTQKKAGKVISSGMRVVSADGKTMTITHTYNEASVKGRSYTVSEVFEKR